MESMGFMEGLLWLTLNIYHEARSEPEVGKLAVAHVTLNRAMEEQKSIGEVVTAPRQFSWTWQKRSYIPAESAALQDLRLVGRVDFERREEVGRRRIGGRPGLHLDRGVEELQLRRRGERTGRRHGVAWTQDEACVRRR